jgi:hypothetical protein
MFDLARPLAFGQVYLTIVCDHWRIALRVLVLAFMWPVQGMNEIGLVAAAGSNRSHITALKTDFCFRALVIILVHLADIKSLQARIIVGAPDGSLGDCCEPREGNPLLGWVSEITIGSLRSSRSEVLQQSLILTTSIWISWPRWA